MKIYTRTGDEGTTALYGGERRPKNDPRISAYGAVDEANSALGMARSLLADPELDEVLEQIQNDLFDLGADLATPDSARQRERIKHVDAEDVAWLEQVIDYFDSELEPLSNFILPGGESAAAMLQVARSVVRRAEREANVVSERETLGPGVKQYLNRLSDLLFVLARVANVRAGVSETRWRVKGRERSTRRRYTRQE